MTGAGGASVWLLVASSAVLAGCGSAVTTPTGIPGVVSTAAAATPTGSSAPAGAGAAQAVQAFLADLHSGNCPAAYALVVDPLRTRAGSSGGLCSGQVVTSTYTVGATTALTSSSALVTVTVANAGQTTTETITVLYQSPRWYVSDMVGQGSATPGPGEVSIARLVGIIEQQYQSMNGASATVSCPQDGTIESTPGQQFRCTFIDSHGRSGSLTVNIRSTGGGFTWSIP
jgi:hypothetical protein